MLQRLLGLDWSSDTALTRMELVLRGGMPSWLLVVLLLGVIGISAGIYRREAAQMGRRWRVGLASIRAAGLGLVVLLAARPALIAEGAGRRPRPVIVLIDNSVSMNQTDRRIASADASRVALALNRSVAPAELQSASKEEFAAISRVELVRAALDNPRWNLLNRLEDRGPLKTYLFGQRTERVPPAALRQAIKADAARTAIADALMEVVSSPDSDPPAAVVLITDGLDNASKFSFDDAAGECAKLGVAIHAWGVGTGDSGMIRLLDTAMPDTLFVDDMLTLPVRWRFRGTTAIAGILRVTFGGREVSRQELTLKPGDGRETLTIAIPKLTMPNPELVINIGLRDDNLANDEMRKNVALTERRVKVLIIDDAPRWEFKFLQPALSRDRRVDASFLVAQGDPRAMKGPPFLPAFPSRDQLFRFDLVILGDVSPAFLGAENIASLAEYVREGGGLAVVAGQKHMPADFVDTPLAEALPVEYAPVRFGANPENRTNAYQPELTPAGRRSALMALADNPDDNGRTWKDLPGFYWHYPVTKMRPGATVLLAHPVPLPDGSPAPLIATQYYGKGPVIFLATDETWRWRYNAGDRLYARFWGQIVYQFGLPHLLGHGARVQLTLDRSDAVVGQPGYVYAKLYDADFRPLATGGVNAVLESIDPPGPPSTLTFDPIPGRVGEYRTLLSHDAPGRFEIRIAQPEAATLAFRATLPPGHELEPAGLNDAPLRDLARATGGAFYREEALMSLPDAIVKKSAPFTARQETLLWGPMAMIVFITLATAEWIGRKWVNLS